MDELLEKEIKVEIKNHILYQEDINILEIEIFPDPPKSVTSLTIDMD